jgi:hypothetical protein
MNHYVISTYCVLLNIAYVSYCYCTCDLNILGTRIEALVPPYRTGLRLGGYVHTSVHKSIPCLRVGGNLEEWPASHLDGHPTIHHLQTDSIKSVEALLDLYIRILMVELTHTTLFL